MPSIEILRRTRGAPDGFTVRTYRAGETHDLPDDLAQVFLREGWGKPAVRPSEPTAEAMPRRQRRRKRGRKART